MKLEMPDPPGAAGIPEEELRLEIACAFYARGKVGKITGAQMAGVDFFTFQRALSEREIPLYTEKMLAEDLETLQKLYPQ